MDTAFDAGALANCTIDERGRIIITIAPEDTPPINCGPWYSFRLHSEKARVVEITLRYEACGHRYWPKISSDGVNWHYLPQDAVRLSESAGRNQARITVRSNGAPMFVSAKESIVPATYDAWPDDAERHPEVTRSLPGQSAKGREQVVLLGHLPATGWTIIGSGCRAIR